MVKKRKLKDIEKKAVEAEAARSRRIRGLAKREPEAAKFFGEGKLYPRARVSEKGEVDPQLVIDINRNIDADILEGKEPLKKQRKTKPLSVISDFRQSGVEPEDPEQKKALKKLLKLRKERE